MSYFKLLGYNANKKLTGSTNSLFSTAVISGSTSAPNLKDMVPPHTSAIAGEFFYEGFFLMVVADAYSVFLIELLVLVRRGRGFLDERTTSSLTSLKMLGNVF